MSNTPSDEELNSVLCHHWPAFSMQAVLVQMWLRDAMRAALAKWGTPQPVVREPLTTLTIAPVRRFLADRGIYLSDETTKELIVVAHGITQKGAAMLSNEQIAEMMRETWGCASIAPRHAMGFARTIEHAHGITKGGQHGTDN